MKYLLFFNLLLLLSCTSRNKDSNTTTKVYGDSLKIITTKKGDTVYQKRIDLKGIKDGEYDNSYDVTAIWQTQLSSELDCAKKITITRDSLEYAFCYENIIILTKQQLKNNTETNWRKKHVNLTHRELQQINVIEVDTLANRSLPMLYYFIRNAKFSIFDKKKKSKITRVRFEKYESPYSSGHIYYLINKEKDTVAKYHLRDWTK